MIVRELITRLNFRVDPRLPGIAPQIDKVTNSAQRAGTAFASMFAIFSGLAAIRTIATIADSMQSLEARISQLPQTVTDAGSAFDEVGKRANAARQGIDAYANLYIKLQNAGKDFISTQEEGLKITDTVAKALVVGGATAQEQRSAILQFGQAIGSGVLQGEELRALAEAAPQFMDEMAKAIGVPRSELKKFASDGKLTSKIVLDAVLKMSSVFDEKFRQMPLTISQSATIISNRWGMFINRLNRESGAVTAVANVFLNAFDRIEAGLDNLVDFFGGATNTLKFFGIAIAAALAPVALWATGAALAFLVSPVGLLIAALTALGVVLEDFIRWTQGSTSVFGRFFGTFKDAQKTIQDFTDKWGPLGTAVIGFGAVMAVMSPLIIGKIASMGLAFAAMAGKSIISYAAMTVAGNTWLGAFLINTAFAVGAWLKGMAATAAATLLATAPLWVWIAVIALVIGAAYLLWKNWDKVLGFVKEKATMVWQGIKDSFGGMVDSLIGYWNKFKAFYGLGADTTITAKTVAGAAASANGVPSTASGAAGGTTNLTVNQTLPAGTPEATRQAARDGVNQAASAALPKLARQLGQSQ